MKYKIKVGIFETKESNMADYGSLYQGPQNTGLATVLPSNLPLLESLNRERANKLANVANENAKNAKIDLTLDGDTFEYSRKAFTDEANDFRKTVAEKTTQATKGGVVLSPEEKAEIENKKKTLLSDYANTGTAYQYYKDKRKQLEKAGYVNLDVYDQLVQDAVRDNPKTVNSDLIDEIEKNPSLYNKNELAKDVAEAIKAEKFSVETLEKGRVNINDIELKGYEVVRDASGNPVYEDGTVKLVMEPVYENGMIVGQRPKKAWSLEDARNAMSSTAVRSVIEQEVNEAREMNSVIFQALGGMPLPPISKDAPITDDELNRSFSALMNGQSYKEEDLKSSLNQLELEELKFKNRSKLQAQKAANDREAAKLKAALKAGGFGEKDVEEATIMARKIKAAQGGMPEGIDFFRANPDITDFEVDNDNAKISVQFKDGTLKEIDISKDNDGGFMELWALRPGGMLDVRMTKKIPNLGPALEESISKEDAAKLDQDIQAVQKGDVEKLVGGVYTKDGVDYRISEVEYDRNLVSGADIEIKAIGDDGKERKFTIDSSNYDAIKSIMAKMYKKSGDDDVALEGFLD